MIRILLGVPRGPRYFPEALQAIQEFQPPPGGVLDVVYLNSLKSGQDGREDIYEKLHRLETLFRTSPQYSHIGIVEDDMVFAPTAIQQLAQIGKDVQVVTGLYAFRHEPYRWSGCPVLNPWNQTFVSLSDMKDLPPEGSLVQCQGIGFGLILIAREVFDLIAFRSIGGRTASGPRVHPDQYFAEDLAKLRIPTYCHTGVIGGHIGDPWIIYPEFSERRVRFLPRRHLRVDRLQTAYLEIRSDPRLAKFQRGIQALRAWASERSRLQVIDFSVDFSRGIYGITCASVGATVWGVTEDPSIPGELPDCFQWETEHPDDPGLVILGQDWEDLQGLFDCMYVIIHQGIQLDRLMTSFKSIYVDETILIGTSISISEEF